MKILIVASTYFNEIEDITRVFVAVNASRIQIYLVDRSKCLYRSFNRGDVERERSGRWQRDRSLADRKSVFRARQLARNESMTISSIVELRPRALTCVCVCVWFFVSATSLLQSRLFSLSRGFCFWENNGPQITNGAAAAVEISFRQIG